MVEVKDLFFPGGFSSEEDKPSEKTDSSAETFVKIDTH